MVSLAAIPHGKDQAQGRKEYLPLALSPWQGKNHSLIKQMSLLILPGMRQLCGSLMQRHSQPLQLLEAVRSLGRAHVQVLFLSWCGVDWPWLWSGDFPWKLLSLGRDSQLRYLLQNRSGQMDHSLETARHLPPLLPPPGTPAAQGHCCWLFRPQDTHCWPARGPRFYVKFGERRV